MMNGMAMVNDFDGNTSSKKQSSGLIAGGLDNQVADGCKQAGLDTQLALDDPDIAQDIRERVSAVAQLCDRYADEVLFDVEYKSIFRSFLARVAQNEPTIFRREGPPGHLAATVVWAMGRSNDLFSAEERTVGEMLSWFGMKQGSSTASQRARTMLRAARLEVEGPRFHHGYFGSSELIHSNNGERRMEPRYVRYRRATGVSDAAFVS